MVDHLSTLGDLISRYMFSINSLLDKTIKQQSFGISA